MKQWWTLFALGAVTLALALPPALAQAPPGAPPPPTKPAVKGVKGVKRAKGAPGAKGQKRGGGKRLQAAMEKLNLTEEQKPKVRELVMAFQADLKKIRQGTGTPKEKRPQVRAARETLMQKLSTILTPEQQKILRESFAKRKNKVAKP